MQVTPRLQSHPERWLVVGLLFLCLGFGALVVHRSAYLRRPQGDFRVFCRAGWAIRQDARRLYQITDDNGWHYHYPPLFAVLMMPLADPPRRDLALSVASAAGIGSAGPLPALTVLVSGPISAGPWREPVISFPLAVALFYLFNLCCLGASVHLLAGSLEAHSPSPADPVQARRRWWCWRLVPILVCLPAVGLTLVRGQVQLVLLLLLVSFLVALAPGRRLLAGLSLAGAICLKVFPVYLLLVPLVRRDGRCLLGCLAGLFLGLVFVPVSALGPEVAGQLALDRWQFLTSIWTSPVDLQPGAAEMLEATGSQSQSFQVILHKTLYLGAQVVPARPSAWVRMVHWLLAVLFTIAVLQPGRMRDEDGLALARRFGLLALLMVLICPVCHLHYLCLAMPLVSVILADRPDQEFRSQKVLFVVFFLAMSLPMLPGLGGLRDVGLPLYAALALGVAGWVPMTLLDRKSNSNRHLSCSLAKCDLG